MAEDFVPYELAVKLKEKGYPQRCIGEFYMIGACYVKDGRLYEDGCIAPVEICFTAPRIDQVLKWLREEKKIHLMIDIWKIGLNNATYKWGYDIVNLTTTHVEGCDTHCANSFEQAAVIGIEYTLYNLI